MLSWLSCSVLQLAAINLCFIWYKPSSNVCFPQPVWFGPWHTTKLNHGATLTHWVLVTPYSNTDLVYRWTLVQVMACCLTAPSHYLYQCWLIIIKVLWHSYEAISQWRLGWNGLHYLYILKSIFVFVSQFEFHWDLIQRVQWEKVSFDAGNGLVSDRWCHVSVWMKRKEPHSLYTDP